MPTVKFGPHEIGRLIMGVNGPGAHFSVKEGMDARAYLTPEKIAEENKHMVDLGVNCMEAGFRFAQYAEQTGAKVMWSARGAAQVPNQRMPWQHPKDIVARFKVKPISIHHYGYGDNGTDALWKLGKLNLVREWCKMVRDTGVLVAVTSHRPQVFMEIESQDWPEVDYYMTCLYKYGRTHAEWVKEFAPNPHMMPVEIGYPTESNTDLYGGEIAFVQGDPPEMLKVVKQCKKACWVYKLLASTRLAQREDIVEDRFKYVMANIKSTDAVVVGMWGKYSDEFALNKEYVIKYGGSSVKVS